ncbi:type II toxin-antitoxin system VapB family antitoxin [Methylobacterium sp. M6A4_1b]
MPLTIRSEEVNRLAEKVAARAKVGKTEVVRQAGPRGRAPGARAAAHLGPMQLRPIQKSTRSGTRYRVG